MLPRKATDQPTAPKQQRALKEQEAPQQITVPIQSTAQTQPTAPKQHSNQQKAPNQPPTQPSKAGTPTPNVTKPETPNIPTNTMKGNTSGCIMAFYSLPWDSKAPDDPARKTALKTATKTAMNKSEPLPEFCVSCKNLHPWVLEKRIKAAASPLGPDTVGKLVNAIYHIPRGKEPCVFMTPVGKYRWILGRRVVFRELERRGDKEICSFRRLYLGEGEVCNRDYQIVKNYHHKINIGLSSLVGLGKDTRQMLHRCIFQDEDKHGNEEWWEALKSMKIECMGYSEEQPNSLCEPCARGLKLYEKKHWTYYSSGTFDSEGELDSNHDSDYDVNAYDSD